MRVREVRSGYYQIWALCDERGDCPTLEFLADPVRENTATVKNMLALLDRTAVQGPLFYNQQKCKHLEDGINEFKSGAKGEQQIRIAWFKHNDRVIICTHGFVKPKNYAFDIATAKEYRRRFLASIESGVEIEVVR